MDVGRLSAKYIQHKKWVGNVLFYFDKKLIKFKQTNKTNT